MVGTSGSTGSTTGRSQESGLTGTVSLGRVRGVCVRAHWTVLIVMVLIWTMFAGQELPAAFPGRPTWQYLLVGGVAAAAFLAGVLAHEVAHAVVARRNGVEVGTVTLWMLGGFTELRSEAPTPGAELRIAGAGPLASLVLGLAAGALTVLGVALDWPGMVVGTLGWLAVINVSLALFNVLPGAPLDGGRLLRATLWKWRGDPVWATIAAARCGRALGVALVVLGGVELVRSRGDFSGLWLALVGWFVMGAARTEEQQARVEQELSGLRVRDVMMPSPEAASPDLTVAEFIDRYLFAYRHSTVPLVEGECPVGLVSLDRVRAVPAGARTTTTLREIARPLSEVPVAAPDDSMIDLLPRVNRAADHRALVVDEGRLVGVVSAVDVSRAVEARHSRQLASAGSRRAE